MVTKISEIIYNELNAVYCDTCRFNKKEEKIWEEEGFCNNPCEDCYRKNMHWEISKGCAEKIAKSIWYDLKSVLPVFQVKMKDNLYKTFLQEYDKYLKEKGFNKINKYLEEYKNQEFKDFCEEYEGKIVDIANFNKDYFIINDNNYLIYDFMFKRIN